MVIGEDQVLDACTNYVRLRGLLWDLPHAHPARPNLAAVVAHADRAWRTLAADNATCSHRQAGELSETRPSPPPLTRHSGGG